MQRLTIFIQQFNSLSKQKKAIIYAGFFFVLLLGILAVFFTNRTRPKKQEANLPPPEYVKNQLIVKLKDKYTTQELASLQKKLTDLGVVSQQKQFETNDPALKNYYILKLKPGIDAAEVEKQLKNMPEIGAVELDIIMKALETPNDPSYGQLWGMPKIHAPEAWDVSHGSKSVVVAVVDTGIDYTHPDLPNDVIKGRNFAYGTDDPMDDHYHGTHVAGTIGGVGNNGVGVAGVNWIVKLMAVKVLASNGSGSTSSVTQGIIYAADNGANVINMSLGGSGPCSGSPAYQDAVTHAVGKGVTVVVAAGNSTADAANFTPASCNGVIAVGATTQSDARASFSNYGSIVDIAAPGFQIYSTAPGGQYKTLNGTSMATPHVAGAAALLLAVKPGLSPSQVKSCLVDNADPISTDMPIGPRLNVYKMLTACSGVVPNPGNPTATPTPGGGGGGNPTTHRIYGNVYNDLNNNAIKDLGEPNISGASIALSGAATNNATTDSAGNYNFPNIPVGSYTVTLNYLGATSNISLTIASSTLEAQADFRLIGSGPNPTIAPVTPTPTPTPTPAPGGGGGGGGGGGAPTPTPEQTYTCGPCSSSSIKPGTINIGQLCCTPN